MVLTRCQMKAFRIAEGITTGMDFCGQPSFGSANTFGACRGTRVVFSFDAYPAYPLRDFVILPGITGF
jgi:hypothetical protein